MNHLEHFINYEFNKSLAYVKGKFKFMGTYVALIIEEAADERSVQLVTNTLSNVLAENYCMQQIAVLYESI